MNTPLPADLLHADAHPARRHARAAGRSLEHRLIALLVLALHAAAVVAMAYLGTRPPIPPESRPIEVAFIPLVAPPPVEVQPPAPPPPPPPVQVSKPPPPKVQAVKPPPRPKPAPPKPAEPVRAQSATALSAEVAEPPPEPAPSTVIEPTAPPPSTVAPLPAPPVPVTAARFDAAYLNNPAPAYPPLSRRMREQGKVMLRVVVTADGRPGHIEVAHGSGSERLDQAARDAVSRWRFVPARQGERAIEAAVLVPIIFKLEG